MNINIILYRPPMTTMTEVRLSDIVILNPVYFDTKLGIITLLPQVTQPGTYRPIYAAGIEGIYRLRRSGKYLKEAGSAFGRIVLSIIGGFILFFLIIAGASFMYSATSALTGNTFILSTISALIELFIGLGIIIGGIFGIIKIIKFARKARMPKTVEAELVIPWKTVKRISVTDEKQVNVGTLVNPIYKTIGNWHVLTDGSDYLIPEVDDPFNKLDYIKAKFNLTI